MESTSLAQSRGGASDSSGPPINNPRSRRGRSPRGKQLRDHVRGGWHCAACLVFLSVINQVLTNSRPATVEHMLLVFCDRCGVMHTGWFCDEGDS